MEQAYDDAKAGRFSRRPYIDIDHPDARRPAMAPPGKHVMSCFVQYAPYQLAEGTWDEQREAFGDAVIDTIAERAPNIRDLIVGRQVLTPLDIERTMGLTEGNIFQGELSPRAAVLQPARARLGALPDADPRPLAVRLVGAPGRRHHGRARPHRGAGACCGSMKRRGRADRAPASRWDAIVVGGGHNGLVCAAYLARAGCGRSSSSGATSVGGAVATSELVPGRPGADARPHGRAARARSWRVTSACAHGLRLVQPGRARHVGAARRARRSRCGATRRARPASWRRRIRPSRRGTRRLDAQTRRLGSRGVCAPHGDDAARPESARP